jgi:hypothetical protein
MGGMGLFSVPENRRRRLGFEAQQWRRPLVSSRQGHGAIPDGSGELNAGSKCVFRSGALWCVLREGGAFEEHCEEMANGIGVGLQNDILI